MDKTEKKITVRIQNEQDQTLWAASKEIESGGFSVPELLRGMAEQYEQEIKTKGGCDGDIA